jgi:peptide deformylase
MIITNNEELLRVKCEEVLPDEIDTIRMVLEAELDNSNRLGRFGIGLAAPQVGIPKKMAIVRLGHKGYPDLNLDLVNAKIEHGYDQVMVQGEGCLSFPSRAENTLRYQEVHVSDNLMAPTNFVATGLLAVCIQHELDHLNQVLMFDRAAPVIRKAEKIEVKLGPNDPCYCGKINPITGNRTKYKKCCGR